MTIKLFQTYCVTMRRRFFKSVAAKNKEEVLKQLQGVTDEM